MFAGHLAVALAAKRHAPRTSLGTLIAASFGIDLLWPLLLLLGVERVGVAGVPLAFTPLTFEWYPWSHSLLMVLVWAALAGGLVRRLTGRGRDAWVVAAVVASHWLLDLVTHAPDLPLWPGGPLVGLGLWGSIPATLAIEGLLVAMALMSYRKVTVPRDRTGSLALVGLVALVVVIWAFGPFSPPPPDARAVAFVGLALWVLPPWGWWIDRHRAVR